VRGSDLEEAVVGDEAAVGAGRVGGLEEVRVPLWDIVGVRVIELSKLQQTMTRESVFTKPSSFLQNFDNTRRLQ
jgi:hypothetical protein